MNFEWNENKRTENLKKHNLDFADAYIIFKDNGAVEFESVDRDYG